MRITKQTPTDAFLSFFSDAKPYHVKLLEVLETFRIDDFVGVSITEQNFLEIEYRNKPLCRQVGFGIEFDDSCGYDAIKCCDYFSCYGGYGLIFDNSDLISEFDIFEVSYVNNTISVSGNASEDIILNIVDISPSGDIVYVDGDRTTELQNSKVIAIAATNSLEILENDMDSFKVSGDFTNLLTRAAVVRITNSGHYNGNYSILFVEYDQDTNTTEVVVHNTFKSWSDNSLSSVVIGTFTKNNGYYNVDSVTFNGTATEILLKSTTLVKLPQELRHGSVNIKNGFLKGREIWVYDDVIESYRNYKVLGSRYNTLSDITTISVVGNLPENITEPVQLRGYFYNAGYSSETCTGSTPEKITVNFQESIRIEIIREACIVVSEDGDYVLDEEDNPIAPEICGEIDPVIGCAIGTESGSPIRLESTVEVIVIENCT